MNIDRLAEEYVKLSEHIKSSEARKATMKDLLLAKIEEAGKADEKGNQWLGGKEWMIKRERRAPVVFNAAAAMEWAEEMGIDDQVVVTITPEPYDVVDEDALAAWVFLNKEHEEKVKSFYEEKITWAFPQPIRQTQIDY